MSERTARLITWGGGTAILAAAVAALALNVLFGETVFAARLLTGLAGCL